METSTWQITGVLNLLLFFWPCVSTQSCPARPNISELDSPEYWPIQKTQSGTNYMSSIVHSFLNSVQPNLFPKDLLVGILVNESITKEETLEKVLQYEAGFLVCVFIGILYIVLMPLIGLCFACCRCCGNCGGRMYQKQTMSINCWRGTFYWGTFFITLVILAGNVCMFLSNKFINDSVDSGPEEINNAVKNVQSYVTTVPKQIDTVLNESIDTVEGVRYHINGIGNLLGRDIQKAIEPRLNLALDSVTVVAQEISNCSLLLRNLDGVQSRLQTDLNYLQSNLTSVKNRINNTLSKPDCLHCTTFQSELSNLFLDTDLSSDSLNHFRTALNDTEKADLNAQIKKGEDFLKSIPEKVTNETRDSVQGVQQQLQDIKLQISHVGKDIPTSELTSIANELNNVQNYAKQYTPEAKKAEHIRWIVALILCCLVLLVVVCNLFGLLLGPVGLKPKVDPAHRSRTSNCAGLFLMSGVGFTFLFSWILMIVVMILTVVGGNTYALICVPWQTQQLFQLIDTPGVIPGFQLSKYLGLKTNLTIREVYNNCHINSSLWTTLHLEEIINLNDFLNISKYTTEIQQTLEKNKITLPKITLLDSNTQNQLYNFSSTASSVNVSDITQKTAAILATNFNVIADHLDSLANNQTNSSIKDELLSESRELRALQTYMNVTISPLVVQMDSLINNFTDMTSQFNKTVENALDNVSSAQQFLNKNTTEIVKSKLTDFVDCQIQVFTSFTNWANQTITEEVGRCGSVAAAVDSVENLLCSQLLNSVNAFWFSLGWCIAFFIPSIILSVKLAKFYRRMKYTDEFENFMMTPIPRVTLKPYE
ncbi:prominin-2 [Trichomycterus rosablanca]|uniref:prominin-2 n=1 Tax=Trichomycterus rosablanca TaxID=2290929 RepID=UPI002F35D4D2